MNEKTRNILSWVLVGVLGVVFIGSAINKFVVSEETVKMAANFGISANTFQAIGVVELLAFVLFVIPRTGIIGTLLLAAYMGGAIATHLEHNEPFVAQAVIEAFVLIVAAIRFPELTNRLVGK